MPGLAGTALPGSQPPWQPPVRRAPAKGFQTPFTEAQWFPTSMSVPEPHVCQWDQHLERMYMCVHVCVRVCMSSSVKFTVKFLQRTPS